MDPSENACIENLRPKTVPEGLIAIGTVVHVADIQIKLQIAGGILCLVDRFNVSQQFTTSLEEFERISDGSRVPPRLCHMFKKGEKYVCKIIERRPRKGYADASDLMATLDPSAIQEENLPKTILAISHVPLQGAVKSVEDHGYQVDIGFKGFTGFLSFEEAQPYIKKTNEGKPLIVGQVIRCYLKVPIEESSEQRVVQLTVGKEAASKGVFSDDKVIQNLLTPKCILPGSKGFLTVMGASGQGLIVNFLNEFPGFVPQSHLANDWHSSKANYKISERYDCRVLYYNQLTNTFALSIKHEKQSKKLFKQLMTDYYIGKVIKKAEVVHVIGSTAILFKINENLKAVAHVKDSLDEDIGTMTKDELLTTLDTTFPEGSKHRCRIKSINYVDLVLVLSLQQDFMSLPVMSVEELKPGSFIEATIKKYVKDGIVVNFGLNLRAIILNQDLNDYISAKTYKRYPIGKTVKCRVLKVDLSKQPARVYLTNKESLMDPNLTIVDNYDKSLLGKETCATIVKISPKGLIVELFNNIKGFIPTRFLSEVTLRNPSDMFKIGQTLSCVVYRVLPNQHRLFLGAIPLNEIKKQKRYKKMKNNKERTIDRLARLDARNKQSKTIKISDEVSDSNASSDSDDDAENMFTRKRHKALDFGEVNLSSDCDHDSGEASDDESQVKKLKSRRQRSEEAKKREESIRETERRMMDPDRAPQSIVDFERLVLAKPDSADTWIKYSKFFLDNVETEKARIVCRRALKTMNFRLEKEKLKIWLQLIKIEAKYGGSERLHSTIDEAAQTNDKISLYRGTSKVLSNCGEVQEAEKLHELMIKLSSRSVDLWIEYIQFLMEKLNDLNKARQIFDLASKSLSKSDFVFLRSKFGQFEFKYGDVERAKTIFENLLSDNPKRKDLWQVYEAMTKKYGSRQADDIVKCVESGQ